MSQIESGKYSISPNSGRLRKKTKKKPQEANKLFAKRLDNFHYNSKVVFVILLIVIAIVLFLTFKYFQDNKGI